MGHLQTKQFETQYQREPRDWYPQTCHSTDQGTGKLPNSAQSNDVIVTMRSIERKLDVLNSTMEGNIADAIANAVWHHIERKQTERSDADDMKLTIVVTGAVRLTTIHAGRSIVIGTILRSHET